MKKLVLLFLCLMLCSCTAKQTTLSARDINELIRTRAQWVYWLNGNSDNSYSVECNYNSAEDLQNAVEHEYFFRTGKELQGDIGLYSALAAEYYPYSADEYAEILTYSQNYNSADGTITPVDDWREENSGDIFFKPVYYSYDSGLYTVFCQLNVWGESEYSDSYSQFVFEYTDDGFINFVSMNTNFSGDMLTYTKGDRALLIDKSQKNELKIDYYENCKGVYSITVPAEKLPKSFLIVGLIEYAQVSLGDSTATIQSLDGYTQLTIDFAQQEYDIEYFITMDDVINRPADKSFPVIVAEKDGQKLVSTYGDGGGDIAYCDLWLFTQDDEKPVYLDYYGGMYGGGSDCGFFKNGDVYIMANNYFHVYENGKLTFSLEDVLPLGRIDENVYVAVSAVRRNDDGTYTVLYSPLDERSLGAGTNVPSSNYQLATIDSDGNVLKTVDTGERVRFNDFGFVPVEMYQKDENTIHFTVKFKDDVLLTKDVII